MITGSQLRKFREAIGLRQPAFAAQLGVSRRQLQELEYLGDNPLPQRYHMAALGLMSTYAEKVDAA